jgi:glycosyltransferase involved in cell wall biosynthesis
MRIGFDGRYAEGNLVGVGKYIKSLILELDKHSTECVVFYSRNPKYKISGKNIKSVILPHTNRYFFEQIDLPVALRKEKVDIYHALGNIGVPLSCPVPAVLTVHDIIPLEIKDYFSYSPAPVLSKLSYLSRLKSSIVKAKRIITVSNYIKRELIHKLKVSSDKIQTIYSGAPSFERQGILPAVLENKKYILNHGGIDIRKNLDTLIKAFLIFHKYHPDYKLVITGDNKRIRGQKDPVIFTGYLSEKDLVATIKNAVAICYPTLSEGFGFPVLEGFGLGVPVIASNTSSIPEVADDAAILVNPKKAVEIERALEKCISDRLLRSELVSKGKAQYNKFRWEKAANEYLNLYNSIK